MGGYRIRSKESPTGRYHGPVTISLLRLNHTFIGIYFTIMLYNIYLLHTSFCMYKILLLKAIAEKKKNHKTMHINRADRKSALISPTVK